MQPNVNLTEVKSSSAEDDSSKWYRVTCSCTDTYHDQELFIEYDQEIDMVSLQIYSKMCYPDWEEDNWFKKIWKRIKVSSKLLFTGNVKVESSFLFTGKEAIDHYVDAIKSASEKIEDKYCKTKVY